jgi:hypothetical protein
MAQTTTTVLTGSIASEILSQHLLALTPKQPIVAAAFNSVSIDGAGSLTYKLPTQTILDAASAVSEGSDASTISDYAIPAGVSVTPTAVYSRVDLTDRAIRRGLGGRSASMVFDAMQNGDLAGFMSLLAAPVAAVGERLWAKLEFDCAASLANASGSVGTSGGDLTIANMLSAIYALEANSPSHGDFAFYLTPIQISDLRTALLAGSGAALSTVLNSQATMSMVNGAVQMNGFKGDFLGFPVFQIDALSKATANAGADDVGALVARGSGDPVTGQRGPSVIVEGHAPRILVDVDMSNRNVEIIGLYEYAIGEHTDKHYIKIVTDAP